MKPDLQNHHRQSIRLSGYDYSQAGAYFVTITTCQRNGLLGEIVNELMHLSPVGQIVQEEWQRLPHRFRGLELDTFSIMPNHLHGIIVLPPFGEPDVDIAKSKVGELFPIIKPGSLAAIVRAYKSSTTLRFNRTRYATGSPLWQRNYYEHIVRHEDDLNRIRQYIQDNPLNWTTDAENQANPANSN
jgi:putative transposase